MRARAAELEVQLRLMERKESRDELPSAQVTRGLGEKENLVEFLRLRLRRRELNQRSLTRRRFGRSNRRSRRIDRIGRLAWIHVTPLRERRGGRSTGEEDGEYYSLL